MQKRINEVTMKGQPVTLLGSEIKVGDTAPNFTVVDSEMHPISLSDFNGKVKIINAVPSVDTSVCSAQLHRFNTETAKWTNTVIFSISTDLPFALKRYCAAEGINSIKLTSDHNQLDFGFKYGVVIEELRLLSRAVFVINDQNKVIYVQYVKENATEPDYQQALEAVQKITAV